MRSETRFSGLGVLDVLRLICCFVWFGLFSMQAGVKERIVFESSGQMRWPELLPIWAPIDFSDSSSGLRFGRFFVEVALK